MTWTAEAIEAHEDELIAINIIHQLYERGENALGESIMDYAPYTLYTTRIKLAKGQPVDRVTLNDTGAFYAGIYIDTTNNKLTVMSADEKTGELVAKYGEDILGLNEDYLSTFLHEVLKEHIFKLIKDALFVEDLL